MSDDPFENQTDIVKSKLLYRDESVSVYKVKQLHDDKVSSKWVRVLHDISNHYAIRREKDLLSYLNQFDEDFLHFEEIRKVNFKYIQFYTYAGKRNLKQWVKKHGPLSEKATRKLLKNVISALVQVHNVSFVHNDIRPENLLVSKDHYYLVGFCKALPMISSYDSEVIRGDLLYTPPEKMDGQISEKSDVYSLGCVLYFALTGKHIYRLKDAQERYQKLYAHAFYTMRKENNLPFFWRQLIHWMTHKDPQKRPSLADLTQWLKDQLVPKFIREETLPANGPMPKNPLDVLADHHYLYALFHKANQYEALGNMDSAFNLYENCAFHEYSRAENNIGLMYERGEPVKQDHIRAMTFFYNAYKKGNPFGAYNLGRLFEEGLGAQVDLKKAFDLYQFAAFRGHRSAQYKLGEFYAQGKAVPKNVIQARFWFGLAAKFGCISSAASIKQLLAANR